MALNADNIVRQNSGGVSSTTSGTPIVVSLAGAEVTEAGNTVVVLFYTAGTSLLAETGWVRAAGNGVHRYARGPTEGLAADESSWSFDTNTTSTLPVSWVVLEFEGVALTSEAMTDVSVFGTVTSGTTAQLLSGLTSTYDGVLVTVHCAFDSASTTPTTWSGHTDGSVEIREQGQSGATNAVGLSVSLRPVQTIGSFGSTATASRTLTATDLAALHTFVLNGVGARKAPNLYFCDGAEHGTATGNAGMNGLPTTMSAGVSVDAAAARSGVYGWQLTSTSAACNFTTTYGAALFSMGATPSLRRCFAFPTLPLVDTDIWVLANSQSTLTFRFIAATGKIGAKISTGAEQISDAAITADQWFGIDLRYLFGTTAHTCDWMVDYNAELTDADPGVAQAQAVFTAAGAGTSVSTYRVGWTAAITATMYTDDGAGAKELGHYPLGDIRILPLKVDPAGTPTTSGATSDFGVMTSRWGTVAAWNATNARNAVDDVPPDLSGTRDAAVALVANASTYAEFPMEPFDLAANKVNVRGVRLIACMTAASATTSTIRMSGWDGVTTFTPLVDTDVNADNVSAVWCAFMLRLVSGRVDWTQARVDALAFRFGSNDATPDIGIDSVVFEVAVVKALPETLFGEAGEPIYVEAHRDPDTQALVGATVNNNSGDPIELTWEVDGVPDSSGSIPDGTAGLYVLLSADGSIETVGRVSLIPG